MSDDLISRKALLDIFSRNSIFEHTTNAEDKNVIEIIKEQPTAFDTSKIIEQLEENARYFQGEADELAQKGDWGTATDLQGRATAYRDAVEIVKSGVVADE